MYRHLFNVSIEKLLIANCHYQKIHCTRGGFFAHSLWLIFKINSQSKITIVRMLWNSVMLAIHNVNLLSKRLSERFIASAYNFFLK